MPNLALAVGDNPANRTTAYAPLWQTGEWWTYRLTDNVGRVYEGTRVVAGIDNGSYVVGFPIDEWDRATNVIGYHLPGMGEVRAADLAFEVHEEVFKVLDFPLRQGASWTSTFEGAPLRFTVDDVTEKTARITSVADSPNPQDALLATLLDSGFETTVEYDAELGEARRLTINVYGSVEILDHGTGWTGTVRAPRAQELLFAVQRIAGLAPGVRYYPLNSTRTTDTVIVSEGYDGMTLTLGTGSLARDGAFIPGFYRETATAPDRTVYQAEKGPTDGPIDFTNFGVGPPHGTWTFEHIVAGPGGASAEGFAYEIHDIEIPGLAVARPMDAIAGYGSRNRINP